MQYKSFDIYFEPLEVYVYIIFAKTVEIGINEHNKYNNIKIKLDASEHKTTVGVVSSWIADEDGKRYYVCVFRNDCKIKNIVHESVHIVSSVMIDKQTEHNEYTEEVYAYHTEWVFDKIYQFKIKNKIK